MLSESGSFRRDDERLEMARSDKWEPSLRCGVPEGELLFAGRTVSAGGSLLANLSDFERRKTFATNVCVSLSFIARGGVYGPL